MSDESTSSVRERHNPNSQNPHKLLSPELLNHQMIGAFIRDERRHDYWRPVHLDSDLPGVKP